jgi:hypothetical protein
VRNAAVQSAVAAASLPRGHRNLPAPSRGLRAFLPCEAERPLWTRYTEPEGKLDFGPQIVIPAKSLFFRSTGVDDDFVVDAFFADVVPARLGHRVLDFDG